MATFRSFGEKKEKQKERKEEKESESKRKKSKEKVEEGEEGEERIKRGERREKRERFRCRSTVTIIYSILDLDGNGNRNTMQRTIRTYPEDHRARVDTTIGKESYNS